MLTPGAPALHRCCSTVATSQRMRIPRLYLICLESLLSIRESMMVLHISIHSDYGPKAFIPVRYNALPFAHSFLSSSGAGAFSSLTCFLLTTTL